jgi:hypothetical protein
MAPTNLPLVLSLRKENMIFHDITRTPHLSANRPIETSLVNRINLLYQVTANFHPKLVEIVRGGESYIGRYNFQAS